LDPDPKMCRIFKKVDYLHQIQAQRSSSKIHLKRTPCHRCVWLDTANHSHQFLVHAERHIICDIVLRTILLGSSLPLLYIPGRRKYAEEVLTGPQRDKMYYVAMLICKLSLSQSKEPASGSVESISRFFSILYCFSSSNNRARHSCLLKLALPHPHSRCML
jgi:hypothetical protein